MADLDPDVAAVFNALADLEDSSFASLLEGVEALALHGEFQDIEGLDPVMLQWFVTAVSEPDDSAIPERDQFLERVARDAIVEGEQAEIDHRRHLATDRIQQLATSRAFRLRSKVRQLRDETVADLTRARIVTDARPVFDVDDEDQVSGYVLMHTLIFDVATTGGTKREMLYCSDGSLRLLKEQIERAERKAGAVQRSLASGDEVVFDV